MPSAVEVLSGDTNRPIDCRAPIVTIRIAAAARVTTQVPFTPPFVAVTRHFLYMTVIMIALYDGHHVSCQASFDRAGGMT